MAKPSPPTPKPGRRRKPRQARSRALVDAVLQSALEVLSNEEVAQPSMKAIARRAGVGIASVYEYFSDRDSLIEAVVEKTAAPNFERLQRVLEAHADAALDDALCALVHDVADLYWSSPRLTRAMLRAAARFDRMDFVVQQRDRFSSVVVQRLLSDMPALDPMLAEQSAIACTEMLSGVILSELYRAEDEARRAALLSAIERALRAEVLYLRDAERVALLDDD